jgi:hypothetical protein
MVRMYVFETLVPNDAKGLTYQVGVKPVSDDSVSCGGGGGLGVPSCNAMNAEHILRPWVVVLSGGGANERITVK